MEESKAEKSPWAKKTRKEMTPFCQGKKKKTCQ